MKRVQVDVESTVALFGALKQNVILQFLPVFYSLLTFDVFIGFVFFAFLVP